MDKRWTSLPDAEGNAGLRKLRDNARFVLGVWSVGWEDRECPDPYLEDLMA